jgi:hypothetical protein
LITLGLNLWVPLVGFFVALERTQSGAKTKDWNNIAPFGGSSICFVFLVVCCWWCRRASCKEKKSKKRNSENS